MPKEGGTTQWGKQRRKEYLKKGVSLLYFL